ncbi:ATP phosphoribosyltransferase regulatory subunit [Vandammella animalimorsus]|uniref:ATP phosphoribosyltransferase regulatory subunit n=1 Tax=Vandammella animalimorsus TaxID=2029117 RepID=A0A3M6RJQ4_9BURK|nr:ATP phosphoribosyltransferase regulatory subunit [Vandammella animalimorsus]RMX15685.1 ATP phosphoribosyltransferase regulatory subunit [Vandammella animalimorsus]
MSAWVLPDHIADVLPCEARHMEGLRRSLLDVAASFGYELIVPPLMEHLESLLTGSGQALELQIVKSVDQLSGRTVGIRADSTPQVARIDAHLLNRPGLARLCYCGPVLHARPERPGASRELLQFGAEIYGHAGPEADLEIVQLALACTRQPGIAAPVLVLGDVRIVRSLLAGVMASMDALAAVHTALAAKDASALQAATVDFPQAQREGLAALLNLYGEPEPVMAQARQRLAPFPAALKVLDGLQWLTQQLQAEGQALTLSYDLADVRGYGYYSGMRFSLYVPGCNDALVRGGRYDEAGAVFGRNRPAAGFSLDVKQLTRVASQRPQAMAIRAPWVEGDAALRGAIARLRGQGEVVLQTLPGSAAADDALRCDRELRLSNGQWQVHQATLQPAAAQEVLLETSR